MPETISSFISRISKPDEPMNPYGPINNIDELCECYQLKKETLEEGTDELTYCKTWFKWDEKKVILGTTIEETDEKIEELLEFPFYEEDFEAALEEIEIFSQNAWDGSNSEIGEID